MKKLVKVSLICILVLILGLVLAACGDNGSNGSGDQETDIETTYYTVKFVTNGEVELSPNEFKYASDQKIVEPEFKPVKKGYKFEYWSTDGGTTAFDFENFSFEETEIDGVFTITAYYTNVTYTHIKDTTTKLVRTENDGVVSYSQSANAYDSEDYPTTGISNITSTYGQKGTLSVPQNTKNDKFCFWYYMDNGTPVQFTEYLTDDASTVSMLESYDKTESLTLYAMWASNLKEIAPVTVNYTMFAKNTSDVWEDKTLLTVQHLSYDNIMKSEVESLSVDGYSIKSFSYLTSEDADPEVFDFAEESEGKVTAGTYLHTILVDSDKFVDYFTPATINIQTNWTKEISVSSVSQYKERLYDVMQGDDENAKAEIQTARITFSTGAIDFGGETFEPLFDANHVFEGTICTLTQGIEATIQNVVLEGTDSISLLGYVDGKIYDINVNSVTLNILPTTGSTYADRIVIGVLATGNAGYIANVDIQLDTIEIKKAGCTLTDGVLVDGYSTIVFGGIVGTNAGVEFDEDAGKPYGSSENGKISDSTIDINSITIYAENVLFGGIVGEAGSISRLVDVNATVTVTIVSATDSDITNGNPSVKLGGIAGSNGGSITTAKAIVNTNPATQILGIAYVGGVTGVNAGDLSKVEATGLLKLTVGGSSQHVGGFVGINEGSIYNCLSKVSVDVTAVKDSSVLNVGGFVGSNISDKTDSSSSTVLGIGAINNSYTTGALTVNTGSLDNVYVNIGGIAGTNAYSKISQCFVLNDISITNKDGNNKVDYFFGKIERSATASQLFYAIEKAITVNGETYASEGETPLWANETALANFSDSLWFFGDNVTDGHMSWDKTIWQFDAGELKLV